jgi:hypothetical protein
MGVCGQCHAPVALPREKTRYPSYRRLCGPQGRYGWVRKISPPLGFEPRTIQSLASRCSDYAIPASCVAWLNTSRRLGKNGLPSSSSVEDSYKSELCFPRRREIKCMSLITDPLRTQIFICRISGAKKLNFCKIE